ncbi:MAG TPA: hypothetical protein VFJ94_05705 [Intrasporangium sp.]|uniref:hypothetical protein n=1 Tax=Intrasporangium sp. TaxID=1925024 RepID=UPI002D790B2C|nr:hypothetical protein [Intrasporangium sp.]HET7397998.1 hypothetical protein [Intrasporangium sp.]
MSEDQLRRALRAVDDLTPPDDDLFVQRALLRGRARAGRRRARVLGAAAAVALVGTVGAGWAATHLPGGSSTTAAGRAADAQARGGDEGTGAVEPNAAPPAPGLPGPSATPGAVPPGLPLPSATAPGGAGNGVPPQRDTSGWLSGASSPQRTAFDALAPTLMAAYGDVFGGAYATDATNTHVVVTVTRHDEGLEALVRSAMPAPSDVDFRVVANTAARKGAVAARVRADLAAWRLQGVAITAVAVDARADRVLVTVTEPAAAPPVERRYGSDVVRAVPAPASPGSPTLPNGSPPPAPQR